jgi:hypothetical protein
MPGNYAINRKKRNSVKSARVRKQVVKKNRGTLNCEVLESLNATIQPIELLVQQATEKRREVRLLMDKPHEPSTKVKLTTAVRPGTL